MSNCVCPDCFYCVDIFMTTFYHKTQQQGLLPVGNFIMVDVKIWSLLHGSMLISSQTSWLHSMCYCFKDSYGTECLMNEIFVFSWKFSAVHFLGILYGFNELLLTLYMSNLVNDNVFNSHFICPSCIKGIYFTKKDRSETRISREAMFVVWSV